MGGQHNSRTLYVLVALLIIVGVGSGIYLMLRFSQTEETATTVSPATTSQSSSASDVTIITTQAQEEAAQAVADVATTVPILDEEKSDDSIPNI